VSYDEEIAKLEREVAERTDAIMKLRRNRAERDVRDLQGFEALSPSDQTQLYRDNPELWQRMMSLKQERAEAELETAGSR